MAERSIPHSPSCRGPYIWLRDPSRCIPTFGQPCVKTGAQCIWTCTTSHGSRKAPPQLQQSKCIALQVNACQSHLTTRCILMEVINAYLGLHKRGNSPYELICIHLRLPAIMLIKSFEEAAEFLLMSLCMSSKTPFHNYLAQALTRSGKKKNVSLRNTMHEQVRPTPPLSSKSSNGAATTLQTYVHERVHSTWTSMSYELQRHRYHFIVCKSRYIPREKGSHVAILCMSRSGLLHNYLLRHRYQSIVGRSRYIPLNRYVK